MNITTTKKGRSVFYVYEGKDDLLAERVTKIIGLLDKPALIWWGIDCALDKVEEMLRTLTETPDKTFIERMRRIARVARFNVSKKALDVGSTVHSLVENTIKEGKTQNYASYDKQIKNGYESFLKWYKEVDIDPIYIEKPILYAEEVGELGEQGFGGQPDLIANVNGEIVVVDWKTSKGIYEPDMPLQLAAYRAAINYQRSLGNLEKLDGDVVGGKIGRLDKNTGEFELKEYSAEELDKYEKAFLSLFRYNVQIKEL